jgi:ribosomal protein S12 methylthiotransferase
MGGRGGDQPPKEGPRHVYARGRSASSGPLSSSRGACSEGSASPPARGGPLGTEPDGATEGDTAGLTQIPSGPGRPGPLGVTVGMVSLGCPKNLVDSEVMLGRLQGAGYRLVADAAQADVIVVNTCAFIDRAKQESVDAILEMAREKETGRARRLVVAGCLTQRYDADLRREIPEIDATLGTGQVDDIVRAVSGEATSLEGAPGPPTWVYDHTAPRVLSTPPWLAYVKISEGCDYACSFCIIPRLRGRHRSRNVEDVVAEVRSLAARGVREVVLVAQDSTRYGLDHGVRDGLAYLLRRLGRVDGIRWIRVMYAYPSTLTDPILDAMASEEKVVKYVDIPLQHASEPVLKRMKRPAGRGNLLGMVERIRERVPRVAVRTSFIVGFPGETEEDFCRLLEFVEAGQFDNVGVFAFSDEEGTASFDLPGRVPARAKEARRRKLMALQKRISARKNRARVGERVEVLIEGTHPDSDLLLRGRTAGQAPEIDGQVVVNDGEAEPGSFVTCEVTEAHPYDLVARIVCPGGPGGGMPPG